MGLIGNVKLALLFRKAAGRLKEARMKGGLKTGLAVLAGTILTAVAAQVNATCPDLLARWPELLMAGVVAGVAVWVKSPKDAPK